MSHHNYAFIDSQNLNLGVKNAVISKDGSRLHGGWKLDYNKFRVYLREKYGVSTAYLFIGYVASNQKMYKSLKRFGYKLVFKETYQISDGTIKGNVDAELVLNAMIEFPKYDQAVIVSGDGDFACLVEYLRNNNKLKMLLVPNQAKYSGLLRKAAGNKISSVSDQRSKLEYIPKIKRTRSGLA